ncbi:MAG: hypothetical protein PHT59_00655, partial [Candidatus Omnitrophica bacterium]|nr:hypothetical protein [Candidatus Omnitrophota bacterium]
MMKTYRAFCIVFLAASGLIAHAAYAQGTPSECDKLKKEYNAVTVDRDNLLIQLKAQGEMRSRAVQAEEEANKLKAEKIKLQDELQKYRDGASALELKAGDLETATGQLVKENESLKKSIEKMTFEYKMVPETKKEIARVKGENNSLQRNVQQLETKTKVLTQQKINDDAQMEVYRMQIKDLKKRYEQAIAKNRVLEKKSQALPQRFAEIARENKTLIKETALMHYNLGVFYTKNKEYTRAVAEFEKSGELNPDDPAVFYNLGYIHAEYLVDRPRSIEYFRKYLSLVKTGDKDMDWVKKYIVTWQT